MAEVAEVENEIAVARVLRLITELSDGDRRTVMSALTVQTLRSALAQDVLAEFIGESLDVKAVAMLLVDERSMRVLGVAHPVVEQDPKFGARVDRVMEATTRAMNEIAARENAHGPEFETVKRV